MKGRHEGKAKMKNMEEESKTPGYCSSFLCFINTTFSLPALGMCTDFTFACGNGICVNKLNAECDTVPDCSDGSDEKGCGESLSLTASC